MKFDYIYTSPILRAYHTASLLFDENKLIQDERLMEMNFGDFEGRKIADIHLTDHEIYDNLWNHPEAFTRIQNGESYDAKLIGADATSDLAVLKIEATNLQTATLGEMCIRDSLSCVVLLHFIRCKAINSTHNLTVIHAYRCV